MKAIFFNNPHDKVSRELLQECLALCPGLEVMDFMDGRNLYRFQGTPAVRIGTDTEAIWEKAIDLTAEEVAQAVSGARELRLSVTPQTLLAGQTANITVQACNFAGEQDSLPQGLRIEIGEPDPLIMEGGEAQAAFADPGIYRIRAVAPLSFSTSMEVTVNA